jgi:hypothetical protein
MVTGAARLRAMWRAESMEAPCEPIRRRIARICQSAAFVNARSGKSPVVAAILGIA